VTTKPPYVVVIRCSKLDHYDPILEIDKVIALRGEAWFGKYGMPLGPQVKRTLESKEREYLVILVRKGSEEEGGNYIYKAYKLLDITREQPTTRGSYPKYYAEFIMRIGSWLRVTPYTGKEFTLDDVITRSSLYPVKKSLATSMRGYFNAVLRLRDDV
jgi:hypothetical protein